VVCGPAPVARSLLKTRPAPDVIGMNLQAAQNMLQALDLVDLHARTTSRSRVGSRDSTVLGSLSNKRRQRAFSHIRVLCRNATSHAVDGSG
jgi:hypothetical protein